MIQPNEEELRAIIGLEGNPNWEILLKRWFRRSLIETVGPHEPVYTKGMQDQLIDMMDKIGGARETLKLIEVRRPRTK